MTSTVYKTAQGKDNLRIVIFEVLNSKPDGGVKVQVEYTGNFFVGEQPNSHSDVFDDLEKSLKHFGIGFDSHSECLESDYDIQSLKPKNDGTRATLVVTEKWKLSLTLH